MITSTSRLCWTNTEETLQKTYGANYGLTCKVPVDKFRYTAGQTKDYAADNGGGTDVHREFCPNCGSFILDYGVRGLYKIVHHRAELTGIIRRLRKRSSASFVWEAWMMRMRILRGQSGSSSASIRRRGCQTFQVGAKLVDACLRFLRSCDADVFRKQEIKE